MTSITQERARTVEVGLALRRRESWGARFDYTWTVEPPRNYRPVSEPAIAGYEHISVTNPGNYSSNDAHMRAIEAIGRSRFPNTGYPYNGAVLPGGVLYEGQPWGRRGAHTVNSYQRPSCSTTGCPSRGFSLEAPSWNNNVNGRALVFARNVDDPITDADVRAAARYWAGYKLAGLMRMDARLHGHRCCAAKDCPGNRVWVRMDDIADLTATYVRDGLPGTEWWNMPIPPTELEQIKNIVLKALKTVVEWESPGVRTWAEARGWNDLSLRKAIEYTVKNVTEAEEAVKPEMAETKAAVAHLADHLHTVEGKVDQILAKLPPAPPTP